MVTGVFPEKVFIQELTFASSAIDQVLSPFDQTMYSLGADYHPDPDYIGYMVGIGLKNTDDGWAFIHLGDDTYEQARANDWCEKHKRGTEFPARMVIDKCSQYGSMPLHIHVQWSHWSFYSAWPGGYRLLNSWETLENPFDFFATGVLSGYDQISFKKVWTELEWFLVQPPQPSQATNRGIFFLPNGIKTYPAYINSLGISQKSLFQNIIHGVIDIAVSPYSEQSAYQDNEGCGVYSVGFEIFRENPFSLEWESTQSDEGDWGYREIFQAEGQIVNPNISPNIYNALFLDGSYFNNAYIVTNCGVYDPSGWNNVYTDSGCTNSWADGICQGAWDTFLAKPEISGTGYQS